MRNSRAAHDEEVRVRADFINKHLYGFCITVSGVYSKIKICLTVCIVVCLGLRQE
jgi:hypothetical protein